MKSSELDYLYKMVEFYAGERKRQPKVPIHLKPSYRQYVVENIKRAAKARVAAR
jgi:hypothetical protein